MERELREPPAAIRGTVSPRRDLSVVVLLSILFRNVAKVIFDIACVLYIMFNLVLLTRFGVALHQAPSLRILLLGSVFFVGMVSTAAILMWRDHRGDNEVNVPDPGTA
jgi:hypothetical protein